MDERYSWLKQGLQRSRYMLFLSMLLSGCMVGPDFHSPKAPQVDSYNAHPLPPHTARTASAGKAGTSQTYIYGRDIPAEWWQLFRSQEINELVSRGIANSPTLVAAQAAVKQAQETLNASIGNLLFPAFDADVGGTRQRSSGAAANGGVPPGIFNVFDATLKMTYNLDVFGGSRREIESLRAQVDYQQFQLLAAYLTLTTNIVTTAFTIASFEDQIKATIELIKAEEGQLDILRKQFRLGGIANTNVLTQQTLVDQTRATLPPLQKSLSQARHAMAVLIGVFPDTPMPSINLNKIKLPSEVPVSLPSKLVKQRPDVRASEALLHYASAQIGVATANLFPQFNITGNYGWSALTPSNLFTTSTKTWLIGGKIVQPVFHGGALLADRRAAIAAFDQAFAQYKQTLLQAFQNTADALRAIETDARSFRDSKAAEIAARRNYVITSQQYRDGGVAYLNLLNAQQQYQQTKIASIQAQALRYADTATLFQALGGGWWNRDTQCKDNVNPTNVTLKCPE